MEELLSEINRRWQKTSNMVFIIYTAIFIFGGTIGIWYPWLFEQHDGVSLIRSDSLFTYSSAILITLISDYFLLDKDSDTIKLYSIFNYFVGLLAFIIIFYGYKHSNKDLSSYLALFGAFIVLLMWILTYSVDQKFDKQPNDGSIGGKASKDKLQRGAE